MCVVMAGATCSAAPSHPVLCSIRALLFLFVSQFLNELETKQNGTYRYKENCFSQPAGLLVAIACGPGCATAQLHGKDGRNGSK